MISFPHPLHSTAAPSPATAHHHHAFAIVMRCRVCRGDEVTRDASAKWDHMAQCWDLAGVQDQGTCESCGETKLVERIADDQGCDLGPASDADRYPPMTRDMVANLDPVGSWRLAVQRRITAISLRDWISGEEN